MRIKLFGRSRTSDCYEIIDFFTRSMVDYELIPIDSDSDSHAYFGKSSISELDLPVVEFDGERLENPEIREIAARLGWVTEPKLKEYDLSIYGAGPAGLSAAVYAASEGLSTVLLEKEAIGGQAGTSSLIENYFGFPNGISGWELAKRGRGQVLKFGVEILLLREGVKAEFRDNRIHAQLAEGGTMVAKSNICATGVEYRRLGLANEDRFINKGLFYGAGAGQAPHCRGDEVFLVGGGNSAGQAAMYFSKFAERVHMIVRRGSLATSLSQYLLERIESNPNIELRYNCSVTALHGEEKLEGFEITDDKGEKTHRIESGRLFVCIGGNPNTDWAAETDIIRDSQGYLVCGPDLRNGDQLPDCWKLDRRPMFLETSVPGCFAAGDVRHGSVKRVAAAVGDGGMAVTFVHHYLAETF
ncbi:MAG: FAD-dependent oxidoreductase [Verrucomicrobiota bacterium]